MGPPKVGNGEQEKKRGTTKRTFRAHEGGDIMSKKLRGRGRGKCCITSRRRERNPCPRGNGEKKTKRRVCTPKREINFKGKRVRKAEGVFGWSSIVHSGSDRHWKKQGELRNRKKDRERPPKYSIEFHSRPRNRDRLTMI